MLRSSISPAAGNVLRLRRTAGRPQRGVASGSGDRHASGNTKPTSNKDYSRQNAELSNEMRTPASAQESKEGEHKQRKKTMAELDEEMKLKLDDVSGEGGNAGVEYEDGKASGLKRGVKENMFRVI